jgi:hypothetical protein
MLATFFEAEQRQAKAKSKFGQIEESTKSYRGSCHRKPSSLNIVIALGNGAIEELTRTPLGAGTFCELIRVNIFARPAPPKIEVWRVAGVRARCN